MAHMVDVRVLGTTIRCAKTAEQIRMPFRGTDSRGPKVRDADPHGKVTFQ